MSKNKKRNKKNQKSRKQKQKKTQNSTKLVGQTHENYLTAAAEEAASRVGKGRQLKGVVHEVLHRDQQNITGAWKGEVTKLTNSKTAQTVDSVTMRQGRVVGRHQLKDISSVSGASKTEDIDKPHM